jgi:hypothetical protein
MIAASSQAMQQGSSVLAAVEQAGRPVLPYWYS